MPNSAFGQFLVNAAQNGINSIGPLQVGGPVNLSQTTQCSFSVDPKIDLSKLELGNLDINQINISDTKVEFEVKHQLGDNVTVSFGVDSSLKDFIATPSQNGTKFVFDIDAVDVTQDLKINISASDTVISLVSPSGTNDFKLSVGGSFSY